MFLFKIEIVGALSVVLEDPGILLNADCDRYPDVWSNVSFLAVLVRVVHITLTAHQQLVVSSNPALYSAV